jgi:hypothetical protein
VNKQVTKEIIGNLFGLSRLLLWLLLCGALSAWSATDQNKAVLKVGSFELADQFGQLRTCEFAPGCAPLVLTIADRGGSEQVAGWIAAVKARYGGRIRIEGVADLSKVPVLLRPLVRSKFKSVSDYPVMLDWEGKVVRWFPVAGKEANIYVINDGGVVLEADHGAATEQRLKKLYDCLDQLAGRRQGDAKP